MPASLFCPHCHATNDPVRTHCMACQQVLMPKNQLQDYTERLQRLRANRTHAAHRFFLQTSPRTTRRNVLIGLGALTAAWGIAWDSGSYSVPVPF
jgi:hypothetical protein